MKAARRDCGTTKMPRACLTASAKAALLGPMSKFSMVSRARSTSTLAVRASPGSDSAGWPVWPAVWLLGLLAQPARMARASGQARMCRAMAPGRTRRHVALVETVMGPPLRPSVVVGALAGLIPSAPRRERAGQVAGLGDGAARRPGQAGGAPAHPRPEQEQGDQADRPVDGEGGRHAPGLGDAADHQRADGKDAAGEQRVEAHDPAAEGVGR